VTKLSSVLAAAALLAGLVGLWVTNQGVEARRVEDTRRLTARLEELSHRLDAAAATHRLIAEAVPRTGVSAPSPAPSVLAATRLSDSTPNAAQLSEANLVGPSQSEVGASRELEWQEVQDSAEAQFIGEPYDRAWSVETASMLRSSVSSRLPHDSRVQSLECRESLCRLETSHRGADQYGEFQRETLGARDFGWQGSMFFSPVKTESSGRVTAVTYLIRPGRPAAFTVSGKD
jgi:hypothetical protein